MPTSQAILDFFKKTKIVFTDGHFVDEENDKHSSIYFDKGEFYKFHTILQALCSHIAEEFRYDDIRIVIGPPTIEGGVIAHWVAHYLSKIRGTTIHPAFSEASEDPDMFVVKRGYEQIMFEKNVLVVNDFLTESDHSVIKVLKGVKNCKGKVVGFGVIFNNNIEITSPRSDKKAIKLVSLIKVNIKTWDKNDCPFCRDGIPINTKIGKGS